MNGRSLFLLGMLMLCAPPCLEAQSVTAPLEGRDALVRLFEVRHQIRFQGREFLIAQGHAALISEADAQWAADHLSWLENLRAEWEAMEKAVESHSVSIEVVEHYAKPIEERIRAMQECARWQNLREAIILKLEGPDAPQG